MEEPPSWVKPRALGERRQLGNLDHTHASSSSKRALAERRRSLEDLGTTAKRAPPFDDSSWTRDLEYVFRMRSASELSRLQTRARAQRHAADRAHSPSEKVTLLRSAEWHEHRATALSIPRAELVATCGKRFRRVRCGCGERDVPVGCDQTTVCSDCRKTHWRRWRKRITRAMAAHLTAACRRWRNTPAYRRRGMPPGIYMITFTMPHSGDIARDRATMGRAWTHLRKAADAGAWWGQWCLTWEVTPGTAGDGHVHMHVAVISSWVPYDDLREHWQRIIPGSIQPDVKAPKRARSTAVQSAADYLAKYVTKGVDPSVFTGQKAGELMAAFRGQRKVSTALRFWRPNRDREIRCPTCGERHRAVGTPPGLATVAPGVRLHPRGWWDVGRRRHEQCSLRGLVPP